MKYIFYTLEILLRRKKIIINNTIFRDAGLSIAKTGIEGEIIVVYTYKLSTVWDSNWNVQGIILSESGNSPRENKKFEVIITISIPFITI